MDRDGDEYVLNGRKWFASNALHQNCKVLIVMGKTDFNAATHRQQSMMVVPIDAPGVTILRNLPVFGYQDREGHGEITFEDVRVPAKDILAGEGEGFAISQARLGPGRIHHCMRAIGMAERALELMCKRASTRITFGKPVSDNANIQDWIAEARIDIEMVRLLTLKAAHMMDTVGNKEARTEIAAIKVAAPNIALKIIDRAIQVHGGGGVTDDFPARDGLRPHAHPSPGGRPGRGAQARHRQAGTAQVPRSQGELTWQDWISQVRRQSSQAHRGASASRPRRRLRRRAETSY